jgi:hypothetical protein
MMHVLDPKSSFKVVNDPDCQRVIVIMMKPDRSCSYEELVSRRPYSSTST